MGVCRPLYGRPMVVLGRCSRYQRSMVQPKTLSETQVELLRWICDGCPAGRPEGED